jgi:hypothetical protein
MPNSPKFKPLSPILLFPTNGANFVHVADVPYDILLKIVDDNDPIWDGGEMHHSDEIFNDVKKLQKFIGEHFGSVGKNSGTVEKA